MARQGVTRRAFLSAGAMAGAAFAAAPLLSGRERAWDWTEGGPSAEPAGWGRLDAILARIADPVFPDRTFDVTKYGAVGDGVRNCTEAVRAAVEACASAGGGRVVADRRRRRGVSDAEAATEPAAGAGAAPAAQPAAEASVPADADGEDRA